MSDLRPAPRKHICQVLKNPLFIRVLSHVPQAASRARGLVAIASLILALVSTTDADSIGGSVVKDIAVSVYAIHLDSRT